MRFFNLMPRPLQGAILAFLTCVCWAFLYFPPKELYPYGAGDLAIARVSLAAILILAFKRSLWPALRIAGWRKIGSYVWLGLLGTTGYYLCLALAVQYGGASMTIAVVGLIPITTLLYERWRGTSQVPHWRLAAFVIAGLSGAVLIAWKSVTTSIDKSGVIAALAALALWTTYKVVNKRAAIHDDPNHDDLFIVCSALSFPLIVFISWVGWPAESAPVQLTQQGFLWPAVGWFLGWSLVLALISSIGATYAFNAAERTLGEQQSAQMVTLLVPIVLAVDLLRGDARLDGIGFIGACILILSMLAAFSVRRGNR